MSWIKADNPKEQAHFNYLEELRQSGATNMWGASEWLRNAFPKDFPPKRSPLNDKASGVLGKWIRAHIEPKKVLDSKPEPKRKAKGGK